MNNGTVCIFDHKSTNKDNPEYNVYITELKNGQWTKPVRTTFHSQSSTNDISLIPDENSILFASFQSAVEIGRSSKGFNIWIAKMTSTGLSNVRIFGSPLNYDKNDIYPSATETTITQAKIFIVQDCLTVNTTMWNGLEHQSIQKKMRLIH